MKARWIVVALAIAAATGFAIAAAGCWWSIDQVEIGPFGSKQCFGGDGCKRAGLGWVGGTERWMRTGTGAWAGCLIAAFVLVVTGAGVAARRVPKLAAKTALVSILTAAIAGLAFIVQFPGVEGASVDRGIFAFVAGIVLGVATVVAVLRAPAPAPTP